MQNTMLDTVVSSNSQELSNASSAIKLFENPLFKARVVMRCSEPWFVAKDVASCIEHSNVSKMCELCRDKDKVVESASNFDSNDLLESGNARITLISESGLYRILAKCNLPKCEPFESWVFDEVLPSIRKSVSHTGIIGKHGRDTVSTKRICESLTKKSKTFNGSLGRFVGDLSNQQFPSWAASPNALQRETSGTVMRTASRPICSQSDGFFSLHLTQFPVQASSARRRNPRSMSKAQRRVGK